MKRRNIYAIIAIVLLIVLFVPFRWISHPNGTIEYSAIAAKYIYWTSTLAVDEGALQINTFRIYFFPENLKDFETLREEFYSGR